ncbi:hypothetical protein NNC19_13635 [Clostridium sp. SHJSY1]|uniref:hypothetical protein n=1 Tax=Clostridium sp. SHJSY1 TaxID=2942483 RepID=UPI0028754503|nr:hypothetical protein [Clostridium sp. SHJSY1]MDS0526728.1 hypothetical protein [Clostridium sp. SHJSY1]
MKCINCKKEIIDGQAYCIYCGEKLSDSIDEQVFHEEKVAEYKANVKEELPVYRDKMKNSLLKNKIAAAIGAVVILIAIIGVFVFNFIKGMPVGKEKLQQYLIGQSIMIDGDYHEIKSDEIKSLEITSRTSEKKINDKIEGKLYLDIDNATVEADISYELNYDKNNSKWLFRAIRNSNVDKIEPKVDLNDSIKELLKNTKISYNYDSIDLKKGLLKDIKDINIDGEGNKKSGTAKMELSNGVVEATVLANFDAKFDLETGKWKLSDSSLETKVIDKEKIVDNISDEDKKKFVMTAFEKGANFPYKYKTGSYDSTEYIIIDKENITDLKVKNFMEYEKTIRAEIEGEATSGDISKIKFSGVVNLDLAFDKSYNSKVEVNIGSLELSNINADSIKKDMLKYKVDSKQITVDMSNTYSMGKESEGSKMFDKIYEGTITVDGAVKNIKCTIEPTYDKENKKYQWKLDSIDLVK